MFWNVKPVDLTKQREKLKHLKQCTIGLGVAVVLCFASSVLTVPSRPGANSTTVTGEVLGSYNWRPIPIVSETMLVVGYTSLGGKRMFGEIAIDHRQAKDFKLGATVKVLADQANPKVIELIDRATVSNVSDQFSYYGKLLCYVLAVIGWQWYSKARWVNAVAANKNAHPSSP